MTSANNLPPAPLAFHLIDDNASPLRSARWAMDIVGPFPKATKQHKFLFIAVDYFSKWVEVKVVASITERDVRKFIWKNIIIRFGVLSRDGNIT